MPVEIHPEELDPEAGVPAVVGARRRWRQVLTRPAHPLISGFVVAIGVLLAIAVGVAAVSLSTVLVSIALALFLALGLDPTVRAMERHGVRKPVGITIVAVGFLLLVTLIVLVVVPNVIRQFVALLEAVPDGIAAIESSDWFVALEESTGTDLSDTLRSGWTSVASLSSFLAVSGGLLQAGSSVVGWISNSFLVVVLTLYFVSSLAQMKSAMASLVPAHRRRAFSEVTDEITGSVGGVIAGGVTLAAINAGVVFVLQLVIGSPVPLLLALAAFFVTLIPLIGSMLFLVIGTVAALFVSPVDAIIFAIGYLVYIQLESYFVTPRVMGRAVAVPAVLIIIGAMTGATLLGLLGALVAIPVVASILIILRRVVIPKQDARTDPADDE